MPFDVNFYDYVLGRTGSTLGNFLGAMPQSPIGSSGINFDYLGKVLDQQTQAAVAQRQAAAATPPGQAPPPGQPAQPTLDTTGRPTQPAPIPGHEAFLRTALPLAQSAEEATGVPAILSAAIAANETGHGTTGGAPWHSFHGIQGEGPAGRTPAGFRAYNSPGESFHDFGRLITSPTSNYVGAWAQYQQDHNPRNLLAGIARAGYANNQTIEPNGRTEAQNWVDQVGSLMDLAELHQRQQAQQGQDGQQVRFQTGTSQYDLGLPRDVADAFCGPTAAIEFAKQFGRAPTVLEAMNLAKESGWTQEQGMAGAQSEVALLNRLGVPAYLGAPDPQKVAAEVTAGRPVIIDTSGHYYQVTGYNQATGTFVFGDAVGRRAGNVGTTLDGLNQFGFGPARTAIYAGGPSG